MPSYARIALYAAVAVCAAAFCLTVEPQTRDDSHYWRMILAGVSMGWVFAYWANAFIEEQWRDHAKMAVRCGVVATVVLGWFNYYQFDRKLFDRVGDTADITYYYTNSKYLKELGYYGLYPAFLLADLERVGTRYPPCENDRRGKRCIYQYRDLRDYEVKPASHGIAHGEQIRDNNFTPERWEEFKHDAGFFVDSKKHAAMAYFYVDHGYNPPPTWSVFGSLLANSRPVEQLKTIASVDILLVGGMFAAIAWAFGFDVFLLASLFFLCTFSGRWPILGDALLRFDWLAALVIAVCCMKKEKYGLAGGFLAYAALNRIFPAIFFFAWGLVALLDTVRTRTLLPEHRKGALGAGIVSIGLIGAALVMFGPETFRSSSKNLLMHNKSYSSYRVGLGDLLLFRGEQTRKQMAKTTYRQPDGKMARGIAAKELIIQDMQPALRGAAVGALLLLGVYVWRTGRRDLWALTPLAILPFFCATNPQINYYNLRLMLILWHGWMLLNARSARSVHGLALLLLFAVEAATQSAYLTPHPEDSGRFVERYFVTCTTSVWMAVYLGLLSMGLGVHAVRFRAEPAENSAAPA